MVEIQLWKRSRYVPTHDVIKNNNFQNVGMDSSDIHEVRQSNHKQATVGVKPNLPEPCRSKFLLLNAMWYTSH